MEAQIFFLDMTAFPKQENVVFNESKFFTQSPGAVLPSPSEVWARYRRDCEANGDVADGFNPPPARFPELNLLVKFGHNISIAEGQTLWTLNRYLAGSVPVPQIYGWTLHDKVTFLYMEYLEGETLETRWDDLSQDERNDVCQQLRGMMGHLGRLKQEQRVSFIGHIAKQPLLDIIFDDAFIDPAGPFESLREFHDWFSTVRRGNRPRLDTCPDENRNCLPDELPVVFTHGDLHRSNIIISSKDVTPVKVVALIDWHQAGWLPSYWEYCKARWTTDVGDEWMQYLPTFLEPYAGYDGWNQYVWGLLT